MCISRGVLGSVGSRPASFRWAGCGVSFLRELRLMGRLGKFQASPFSYRFLLVGPVRYMSRAAHHVAAGRGDSSLDQSNWHQGPRFDDMGLSSPFS